MLPADNQNKSSSNKQDNQKQEQIKHGERWGPRI